VCAHDSTFRIFKKKSLQEKIKHNTRIKDIAQKAGVSAGTVDRVLHQRGEVSVETRIKVMRIIEELDYSPNLLASTLASSRPRVIAVLIPSTSKENPYWAEHLRGIRRAGIEMKQYGLRLDIHTFSMSNTRDFRKKSEKLLKANPDSLLIAPVFYRESVHFLGKCRKKGIPFAFIDTPIDQFEYLSFIGQNSCQSGAVSGKLLSIGNLQNGKYLVFNITREKDQLYHLTEREKGFRQFFDNKGYTPEIISADIHDGANNSIRKNLIPFREKPDELNGIFVTGSKVHRVASVLDELKMTRVRLVGYDLTNENREYLKKDIIDFLISQQPEEQGYLGITTIFNHLVLKKEIPGLQAIPIDIITRENLEQYPKCQ